MFRQRLLTTLILVPLALFIINYGSLWVFSSIVLLLLIGAAFEGAALIPIDNRGLKVSFVLAVIGLSFISYMYFSSFMLLSLICWLILLIAVLSFPNSQKWWGYPFIVTLFHLILLPVFAAGLVIIYQQAAGKNLIVYLLFIVWAADIGAYLAGKQFGRHKLIPQVSPGKTIEGAIGGLLLSMLVALTGFYLFKIQAAFSWFLLAFVLVLVSMLGDLFVSMLKRRVKLKDTGNLLPGHGGILDRLDSLIAATPFFCKGLMLLAGQ